MALINLTCPNCSAPVELPEGAQSVICSYCKTNSLLSQIPAVGSKRRAEKKPETKERPSESPLQSLRKQRESLLAELEAYRQSVRDLVKTKFEIELNEWSARRASLLGWQCWLLFFAVSLGIIGVVTIQVRTWPIYAAFICLAAIIWMEVS